MNWIMLWKVMFVAGVALYTIMAVWVTVWGLGDIKRLFARLNKAHEEGEGD